MFAFYRYEPSMAGAVIFNVLLISRQYGVGESRDSHMHVT